MHLMHAYICGSSSARCQFRPLALVVREPAVRPTKRGRVPAVVLCVKPRFEGNAMILIVDFDNQTAIPRMVRYSC